MWYHLWMNQSLDQLATAKGSNGMMITSGMIRAVFHISGISIAFDVTSLLTPSDAWYNSSPIFWAYIIGAISSGSWLLYCMYHCVEWKNCCKIWRICADQMLVYRRLIRLFFVCFTLLFKLWTGLSQVAWSSNKRCLFQVINPLSLFVIVYKFIYALMYSRVCYI